LEFIEQQAELEQLVHDILNEARQQGADEAEVSVSAEEGLGVSVRKGELETLEFNQDRGFGVTVSLMAVALLSVVLAVPRRCPNWTVIPKPRS
jgi:hypothetical protein